MLLTYGCDVTSLTVHNLIRLHRSESMARAGCNLAVDVTWKYLNFFMSDDKKLKHIESEYGSGRMLTGEAKAELIKVCM